MRRRRGMRRFEGCRFPGERNPRAVLTWARVRVLRDAYARGWSITALAEQFNLKRETVRDVVRDKTWYEGDR